MKHNFKQLKKEVLNILKQGRQNWDIPHTLTSVYYMKKLLKHEHGDKRILITTMYLHDIGYSQIQGDLNGHSVLMNAKSSHMKNGVIIAEPILEKLNYNKTEIEQILNLIGCHDDLNDLSNHDKQLVFEADSLGQMDIKRAKSNLKLEDMKKFIKGFEKFRLPKFKTRVGIKLINKLFPRAKKFYLKNL